MEMPDITLVQKLVAAVSTAVGSILTVLLVFGVVDPIQAGAVGGIITALGGVYVAADAVIRNGRSRVAANPEAMRELEKPAEPVQG